MIPGQGFCTMAIEVRDSTVFQPRDTPECAKNLPLSGRGLGRGRLVTCFAQAARPLNLTSTLRPSKCGNSCAIW